MRSIVCAVTAILCAGSFAVLSAQKPQKPPKTITLSGCVVRDEKTPGQFTLDDPAAGGTYKLIGKDFREFVGRRVQLDGGLVVKGFKVAGGLTPNPNVAAQAGAMDPSRAAVQAATSGSGIGPAGDVPEFRVKTIRPTGGPCKDEKTE